VSFAPVCAAEGTEEEPEYSTCEDAHAAKTIATYIDSLPNMYAQKVVQEVREAWASKKERWVQPFPDPAQCMQPSREAYAAPRQFGVFCPSLFFSGCCGSITCPACDSDVNVQLDGFMPGVRKVHGINSGWCLVASKAIQASQMLAG
jgi:hypothetical protein